MELVRLVVPELPQQDFLHHYHTSLEGGYQRIGKTYRRIRSNDTREDSFGVSRVMWQNVLIARREKENRFFAANLRGMSKPLIRFAMDQIPSLTRYFKGNTKLLLVVDLFSGFGISKARSSRTAQKIAESYEECVFRRLFWGPVKRSVMIDSQICMSDFF